MEGSTRESKSSLWWKDLSKLYWDIHGEEIRKEFYKSVGNGNSTLFWHDRWSEMESLKVRFNRLFRLSLQKYSQIREMGQWEEGIGSGNGNG
ncbi:hypothetical protein ACS0TY_007014 [Phlomoides rotata]